MGASHLIGFAALAGGAYWFWKQQQDVQEREAQLYYANLQAQKAPKSSGADPILAWGLDTVLNLIGKSGQSSSSKLPELSGTGGNQTWLASLTDTILGGITNSTGASAGGAVAVTGPAGRADVPGLLYLIGSREAPQGYDQVYGGSVVQPPRPITTMTVAEVIEWQDRSAAAGSASTAAGRYQVIRSTMRSLVSAGTLKSGEYFNQAAQDRAGLALLERRGLSSYQAGRMSADTFANNLAKEWASLPVVTGSRAGQSYYAGDGLNKALASPSEVMSKLGAWA